MSAKGRGLGTPGAVTARPDGIRTPPEAEDLPAPRCPRCAGFVCLACKGCDCKEHACNGAHWGPPASWKEGTR